VGTLMTFFSIGTCCQSVYMCRKDRGTAPTT
jgi:hypothetical protein